MISNIKNFLVSFSILFFLASITSFTAFNWNYFSNVEKLLLPSILLLVALFLFLFLKQEKYQQLSLFFACFLIGVLFAVFGQSYQTGANSWVLFRNWAFFLILPIVLTGYYSLVFLLVSVFSLATFFYLGLYYSNVQASYIATLFPACIIACYPFIIEKWKLPFHTFFYRSTVILFYSFFHFVGASLIFSNPYGSSTLDSILIVSYPIVLIVLFFIGYKRYKQYIFLPFSILSVGIVLWLFFSRFLFRNPLSEPVLYFFISILIFIGTFAMLKKQLPPIEHEFFHKILNFLGISLKMFIFLLGIGFTFSTAFLVGSNVFIFLFLGVGLLIFSCFFPKILQLKEDKVEVISFALGLFAFTYFLSELLESQFQDPFSLHFFLGCFHILLFDVFFCFRPSKAFDFLFAPSHYYFLVLSYYFIAKDYTYSALFSSVLFLLGLLILSLQLLCEKKIELLQYKDRIQRVFYGNCLFLVLAPWLLNTSRDFLILEESSPVYFLLTVTKNIEMIAIVLLSILILFFAFPKRSLFVIVFIIIQYFASYIDGANLTILLLLLFFYLQKKWTSYALKILLALQVFQYYYHLSDITLLKKSYYLFLLAVSLLIAYVLIQYLGKGLEKHEQK